MFFGWLLTADPVVADTLTKVALDICFSPGPDIASLHHVALSKHSGFWEPYTGGLDTCDTKK